MKDAFSTNSRNFSDGNISSKYKSHAFVLEKYLDDNRQDPRWIFYLAQSYHDSASVQDNVEENAERLRRSLKYYRERTQRLDGYPEEIYYSQYRIGTIMRAMEEPWSLTMQECLKAYAMDPTRGESIKTIIDYYLQTNEWNMAYLYTKFAKVNYHGKNPYPTRLLFVDEALYVWKFAESHAASCFYTGRMDEAKACYQEILDAMKIKEVTVDNFLSKKYSEPVYVQIDVLDYNKRKDGKVVGKNDFYTNPAEYTSDFDRFTKVSDIFIAGHFYGNDAPHILTQEMLKANDCKIKVMFASLDSSDFFYQLYI